MTRVTAWAGATARAVGGSLAAAFVIVGLLALAVGAVLVIWLVELAEAE